MAYRIPGQQITLPASSLVLSSTSTNWQFRFVDVSTGGTVVPPTTNHYITGVLQNRPRATGEAATIMTNGVSKVRAAASTLGVGDLVQTTTAGLASVVTVSSSLGANPGFAVGRVVSGSSGSAGRILTVQISVIGTT